MTGSRVDSTESRQRAVEELLAKGPDYVVLTLGANGAMFAEKPSPAPTAGTLSIKQVTPGQDFLPEKVVDTTVSAVCRSAF